MLHKVTYTTIGSSVSVLSGCDGNDGYHVIFIMLWKSINLFKIQHYSYSGFFYVLKLNFVLYLSILYNSRIFRDKT